MSDRNAPKTNPMPTDLRSAMAQKIERVRAFLADSPYDGAIFARKDNFAWLTCGGTSEVVLRTELGTGILVVTRKDFHLIAYPMDGPRIIDEILDGIPVEYDQVEWYESTLEERAARLAAGKRTITDVPIPGADCLPKVLSSLHYPLAAFELDRLRLLGATSEQVLRSAADAVAPGMTELGVAGLLKAEYARLGVSCDVVLVGSDERVSKYRHPIPTHKKIEKFVLLHSAVQKWGLHANVTRLVCFGEVPQDLNDKYDAASTVEAAAISMCVPGARFSDILIEQKRILAERGYSDEWRYHFLGGITGYLLAEPSLCLDTEAVVQPNQAYDWFITVTGVKVEELSVNTGNEQAVYSVTGEWPTKQYSSNQTVFELPDILCKQ